MATKVYTVHTSTIEYQTYGSGGAYPLSKSMSDSRMDGGTDTTTKSRIVYDTLDALVTDVNRTAEVLKRGSRESLSELRPQQRNASCVVVRASEGATTRRRPVATSGTTTQLPAAPSALASPRKPLPEAIKVQPSESWTRAVSEPAAEQRREQPIENSLLEDFGIDVSDGASARRTPKSFYSSMTSLDPSMIEPKQPVVYPVCAACNEEIRGKVLTALAAGSERCRKFHPEHFVCTYCLKPLNLKGTYKEHATKPYCHECSYRLFSGLIMPVEQ